MKHKRDDIRFWGWGCLNCGLVEPDPGMITLHFKTLKCRKCGSELIGEGSIVSHSKNTYLDQNKVGWLHRSEI